MLKFPGRLEAAITRISSENGESIPAVAQRLNIAHATIYRIMKGRRPEADTLRQLCHEFARDPEQSAEIMLSYILDEIARAGMENLSNLIFKKIEIDGDARLIRTVTALLKKNHEARRLLEYLARLSGVDTDQEVLEAIAEKQTPPAPEFEVFFE